MSGKSLSGHYSQLMVWRNPIGDMADTDDYRADPKGCWEAFLHDDGIGTGRSRIKVIKVEKVSQDEARIHILASKKAVHSIVGTFSDGMRFMLNGHVVNTSTYTKYLRSTKKI